MKRLLAAAGLTAAFAATVAVFATMGTAQSSTASQAQYAPSNTGAPTISGTPQEGQTLTATTGTWSSTSNTSYAFQWQRCNASGQGCANIAGATSQTYVLTSADVGNTVRVVVTATNADGSNSAPSSPTAVVTAKTATTTTTTVTQTTQGTTSGATISAANVNLPDRLVIDSVKFTPGVVHSVTSITARFHVKETQQGKSVSDALVYAIGLPYSRVSTAPEVKTDGNGWATVTFQPAKLFPRNGYITFFVRARKPGDDVLAGVSTRRLVQITVNR
jgi:hypothetical protein